MGFRQAVSGFRKAVSGFTKAVVHRTTVLLLSLGLVIIYFTGIMLTWLFVLPVPGKNLRWFRGRKPSYWHKCAPDSGTLDEFRNQS